jgi:hypothetical protein
MNMSRVSRIVIGVGVALLVSFGAQAGPGGGPTNQGVVKLTDVTGGQFFFADTNNDLLWNGGTDAQFRIQGGQLVDALFVQGDVTGNTQTQLGQADTNKFYFESGNFAWTPATDTGDFSFFFAPNVGLSMVGTGDWNVGGRDCVMKVGTDQFIFVDANCNDVWEGGVTDAQFRIEGGTLTGIPFIMNDQIGIMTDTKWFIESGNFSWTPGTDTGDVNGFFAPNVGTVVGVVVTDFNGDGTEDFAKILSDGFIFADLNGNMVWDGAPTDGQFKIQGGGLTGPYVAGTFQGQNGGVGQFDVTKIFVDGNATNPPDAAWTPGAGTESANFFAPNVGSIQAAGAGSYGPPN